LFLSLTISANNPIASSTAHNYFSEKVKITDEHGYRQLRRHFVHIFVCQRTI